VFSTSGEGASEPKGPVRPSSGPDRTDGGPQRTLRTDRRGLQVSQVAESAVHLHVMGVP